MLTPERLAEIRDLADMSAQYDREGLSFNDNQFVDALPELMQHIDELTAQRDALARENLQAFNRLDIVTVLAKELAEALLSSLYPHHDPCCTRCAIDDAARKYAGGPMTPQEKRFLKIAESLLKTGLNAVEEARQYLEDVPGAGEEE